MIRRTALALAVVLGVAAGPVAAPVAAQAPDHGAAGIGDAYFPLDGNGGIDVLRYDVHNRYSFARARLSGWTRVTLEATERLSGFNLDFLLPVTSVKVGGKDVRYDQRRFHELSIHRRVAAGERLELVVRYAGKPGRYAYAGEQNWLSDRREVVAMNQPHMAPWWFPSNDHPRDRARISISITVPKDKVVVANGEQVGRTVDGGLATTTWRPREPMVPYLAFFAAGDFTVAQGRGGGGVPWVAAVSKQLGADQQAAAMRLMKRTPDLLSWLETLLGDYPFSTTGGLTTSLPVGFALENQTRPTYPFMGEGLRAVQTVVHELAHQWFGDHVAVESWKDIWINEGPATFFEVYYNEVEHGVDADTWLRNTYDAHTGDFWKHEVADPCADLDDCVSDIFAPFVYDRGAMTLQALRNVVDDDEVFFALLRRWVQDRAGTTGSTAQFESLAEEVTGRDLDAFFDAWLHTPAKPARTAANGF